MGVTIASDLTLWRLSGDVRASQPRRDVPPRLRVWPILPVYAAKANWVKSGGLLDVWY